VGLQAEDIKARAPSQSKYFLWAQQTASDRRQAQALQAAVAQEQVHAETEKGMQRQAVLNARSNSCNGPSALANGGGAPRPRLIAREAVETSEQLFNIGSRPSRRPRSVRPSGPR
jgi:hypothetical protein